MYIFFSLIVFGGTEVPIVYIFLCRPSEDSLQWSAIPDGSPSWDSSPLWAGEIAGFEPRTAVLQSGVPTNEPPLLLGAVVARICICMYMTRNRSWNRNRNRNRNQIKCRNRNPNRLQISGSATLVKCNTASLKYVMCDSVKVRVFVLWHSWGWSMWLWHCFFIVALCVYDTAKVRRGDIWHS
jgi:hypothetical protein